MELESLGSKCMAKAELKPDYINKTAGLTDPVEWMLVVNFLFTL